MNVVVQGNHREDQTTPRNLQFCLRACSIRIGEPHGTHLGQPDGLVYNALAVVLVHSIVSDEDRK